MSKQIKVEKDKHRKCALCDKAYMNMLRISSREQDYYFICFACGGEVYKTLKGIKDQMDKFFYYSKESKK